MTWERTEGNAEDRKGLSSKDVELEAVAGKWGTMGSSSNVNIAMLTLAVSVLNKECFLIKFNKPQQISKTRIIEKLV